MRITKRRVLYVFAALLGVIFVLACLAGFAACGGSSGEEHVHTWDAGVVTKEADCGNAGETTYTCTECGETKTEALPAATGNHTWDEGKVTKDATTEAEGEMTYTCTVCGATKTEKIDKLESSGDDDEGNEPGTGGGGGDENPGGDVDPGTGTEPDPDPSPDPEPEEPDEPETDYSTVTDGTGTYSRVWGSTDGDEESFFWGPTTSDKWVHFDGSTVTATLDKNTNTWTLSGTAGMLTEDLANAYYLDEDVYSDHIGCGYIAFGVMVGYGETVTMTVGDKTVTCSEATETDAVIYTWVLDVTDGYTGDWSMKVEIKDSTTNEELCTYTIVLGEIQSYCEANGGHVLTGTYDSTTTSWTYICDECGKTIDLAANTDSIASLTLIADDATSLSAACTWNDIENMSLTIDVVTTDANQGTITVSASLGVRYGEKTIILDADIDMTEKVFIVLTTVELDLNGHSIYRGEGKTSSEGVVKVGQYRGGEYNYYEYGNLTVKDSSEGETGKISGQYGVVVLGGSNDEGLVSSFTLVSGTIEGSVIAISTNGSTEWGAERITVQGGKVIGTGETSFGIYLPSGTLTVSGGSISGVTGIEIKAGSATITGGEISTTVEDGTTNVVKESGSTDTYGYAIGIIDGTSEGAYKAITSVTIGDGVTLTGTVYVDASVDSVVTVCDGLNLVKVAYDASDTVIDDATSSESVDHYVYGTHCEMLGHVLVGTYADGSWTYTCSGCDEEIELTADTLVASLTLKATDEASLRAAGLWGGVTLEVTPVIDVATTTENGGTITVSSDHIRIGGGDTPMDKDIVLNADIDMTSYTIIVRCECVMDLNGHTIFRGTDSATDENYTSQSGVVQVGSASTYGDLTVKDSSAEGTGKISGQYGVVINAATNDDNKVSTFTLVSGTVEGSSIAISTNGSSEFGAEFINIQGGTVSGGVAGIYLPSGSLTVSGGEISGMTGIEIKAGFASITGGTISTTVEDGQTSVNKDSGSVDTIGYAIAVINGSGEGAYKAITSVTIGDGVTLTGTVYVDASVDDVVTICDGLDLAKDACDESGDVIADETAEGVDVDHYIYRAKTECEKNGHIAMDYGDGKVYYVYNSEDGKWYAQCATCGEWVIELDLNS